MVNKKYLQESDILSLEDKDGVMTIQAEHIKGLFFGIKDGSLILITSLNGNFAADGRAWPDVILETAEIYNTYFTQDTGKKIIVNVVAE